MSIALVGCPAALVGLTRRAVRAALAYRRRGAHRRGGVITVTFVDEREMARLNARWLGHAGPTDVLTFPERGPGRKGAAAGEIIVSLDAARREAAARGHAWQAEALLYVVHGVLHLRGWDDRRSGPRRRMHAAEDGILRRLGYGTVYHSPVRRAGGGGARRPGGGRRRRGVSRRRRAVERSRG